MDFVRLVLQGSVIHLTCERKYMYGYKKLSLDAIAANYANKNAVKFERLPAAICLYSAYHAGVVMGKRLAKQEQERKKA